MDVQDRYGELAAKVDRFFAAVQKRHGEHMQCGAGCADCCRDHLSVTLIEAAHIGEGLMQLSADTRARLRRRGQAALRALEHGRPHACAALDDKGRCEIYAWRPLVCRSHGVPIRKAGASTAGESRVHLPMHEPEPGIDVCGKNFGGVFLDSLDASAVLDQTTLSTVLGALDAAFADHCEAPRGTRIDLAALLADPDSYFALSE